MLGSWEAGRGAISWKVIGFFGLLVFSLLSLAYWDLCIL
jgi:hypothetical protein